MAEVTLSSGRRRLILSALRLGGASLMPAGAGFSLARATTPASERPRFMRRAFELRQMALERGDHGYGAVVVKDGAVVGEGGNAVNTIPDPTAHSEVQAIRDAARRLGVARLTGCELFTNARPCPMCEMAAYWAGIERVYYGEAITDAGAPRYTAC